MKKFTSLIVFIILILLGITLVFSKETGGVGEVNFGQHPPEFIREAIAIMQENEQENYFSAIEMTVGEQGLFIDGEAIPAESAEMINGELILPMAAIAEAIDSKPNQRNKRRASQQETEQMLNVNIHRNGNKITITKPFQRKELVVQTIDGSKLADTFGAVRAAENGHGLHLLSYSSEKDARNAQELLSKSNQVDYAEPNVVIYANFSEPELINITAASFLSIRWGSERIAADRFKNYLYANNKTNSELVVAVIDSGIDSEHEMFKNRLSELGYNFRNGDDNTNDTTGHGTHVSGTIVDCTTDNVMIMPIKVLDSSGGTSLSARFAMEYATDNGAKVINMSFGTTEASARQTLQAGVDYAVNRGVACVVAAGNQGANAQNTFPAAFSNVITVAATNSNDQRWSSSNFGSGIIDVAAPGVSILSALPGGQYGSMSGTSMASPHAAAAVTMLKLDNINASPEQLKTALTNTATDMGNPHYFGAGIIDFYEYFGDARLDITDSFTDPNFLAAVREELNIPAGNPILMSNVARVKSLYVDNKNITSLNGIEHFAALTILSASKNQLTAVDVSHNTALRDLNICDNQLTALDISNNAALEILAVHNNQLTALDVSGKTALTNLNCQNNRLTELNLTGATALMVLDCQKNKLAVLDVSTNTTILRIRCQENNLTGLDVSKNTELLELYCERNYMVSPDDVIGWEILFSSAGSDYPFCFYPQIQLTATITIDTQPADITIIEGRITEVLQIAATVSSDIPLLPTLSYQWYYNDKVSNSGGILLDGQTDAFYIIPPTLHQGEYYYYCVLNADNAKNVTSNVVTVTVTQLNTDTDITDSFTDPNFLAAVRELIDKPAPEPVLLSDVEQVTGLDVIGKQITSLNGIEHFTALIELSCGGNQLIELDVSNNHALESLDCSNNQLTVLDVSNNLLLEILFCDNNQLTELDVSNNLALKRFDCSYNFILSPDSVMGWENLFDEPGSTDNDPFRFYPQKVEQLCDIEAFVTRIYQNVLEREPEPEGLSFWSDGLRSNAETAASIMDNFFFGSEFLGKSISVEQFVLIAYRTFMGREAEDEGLEFWLDTLESGFNRRYVVERMLTSDEFKGICEDYGIELGPVDGVGGFVVRMYKNVLGRNYDRPGLEGWVNDLMSGIENGTSIVSNFFSSTEFLARMVSDSLFLEIAYNTLMARDPEAEGMRYWMNALQNGADRMAVLNDMIKSNEFNHICEDYGIHTGSLITKATTVDEIIMECDVDEDIIKDVIIIAEIEQEKEEEQVEVEVEEAEVELKEADEVETEEELIS